MSDPEQWDVFVSHASEDKHSVARPLTRLLEQAGLKVWLDENELTLGDSLSRKIDEGLSRSRFGVVILSRNFFGKDWPQRELAGLAARQTARDKVILPVWHDVDHALVARYSPTLADVLAVSTAEGMEKVVQAILLAIRPAGPRPVPALPLTPENPLVQMHLAAGDSFLESGEHSRALEEYAKARAIEPTNTAVLLRIPRAILEEEWRERYAYSLLGGSRLVDPEAVVAQGVEPIYQAQAVDPSLKNDTKLLLQESYLRRLSSNRWPTRKFLDRCLKRYPDDPDFQAEAGLFRGITSSDPSEGMELVRRAIEARRTEPRFRYYLACLLGDAHDDDQAISQYYETATLAAGQEGWPGYLRPAALRAIAGIFWKWSKEKPQGVLHAGSSIPLAKRARMLQEYCDLEQPDAEDRVVVHLAMLYHRLGQCQLAETALRWAVIGWDSEEFAAEISVLEQTCPREHLATLHLVTGRSNPFGARLFPARHGLAVGGTDPAGMNAELKLNGQTIISINGRKTTDVQSVAEALAGLKPGELVRVECESGAVREAHFPAHLPVDRKSASAAP